MRAQKQQLPDILFLREPVRRIERPNPNRTACSQAEPLREDHRARRTTPGLF